MTFRISGIGARAGGGFACRLIVLTILWLAPASPGSAESLRGVALVIGNSAYEHLPALPNPASDARAVENLLNDLGFETTLSSDRDARRLARDLRDFVEDAEGADVAVVYYAGHGIEAGGENFLVPVDADLSALEAAGEKLVPVSSFIGQLQASVPVTIVMLDACRDNPFPPGSTVRLDASADPAPMGTSGLGETRGATRLTAPAPAQVESYGTVLAFAAEPGKVALDGEPGGNSPYTQAVLRHFDAMAGEEFGTVMRMVAEEVYLKTSGAQRPWVNESLRRLLYLGAAPEPLSGDEGERRQLLVTIAALPDFGRRQVERVAQAGGVPMDALYGMLRTLGSDIPDDPAKLEEILRGQTEHLKTLLAEREAVTRSDPEIERLSALSREAVREGALTVAQRLREAVTQRAAEIDAILTDQEDNIRERRIELAATHAESAEIAAVAFDHLGSARYWRLAFEQVERWDDRLAWRYKRAEAIALTDYGNYKGDNAALERAIEASRQALRIAEDLDDRDSRASTQAILGNTLAILGRRDRGTTRLEEAVEAYRAALEEYTRERDPHNWATIHNNLGGAFQMLGERTNDMARLEAAAEAYRTALEEHSRESAPLDWALAKNNLGFALHALGKRERGTEKLEAAVKAFRAALEERTRERVPLAWAMTQNNLGNTLGDLGEREGDNARLEEAVVAYRAALQELTRERMPHDWAAIQDSLGNALVSVGIRETGTEALEEAVAAYRSALEERTRDRVPLDWAMTQLNLGNALVELGNRSASKSETEEGRQAISAAWQVYREAGYTQYDDYFRQRIAEAEAALAALD